MQAELIRARVAAGNSLVEIDDQGRTQVGDEAKAQYDFAAQAWEDYLKTTDNNPDPTVAVLVAGTLFSLAQGSAVAQFEANIKDAARAQQFVADSAAEAFRKEEGPPPTGALVTLATVPVLRPADRGRREEPQEGARVDPGRRRARADRPNQLDAVRRESKRIGGLIDQAKKQAQQDGGELAAGPAGRPRYVRRRGRRASLSRRNARRSDGQSILAVRCRSLRSPSRAVSSVGRAGDS